LFANNASNAWAVFNASLLPSGMNLGGDRFHDQSCQGDQSDHDERA
jgi:hypothetical protein